MLVSKVWVSVIDWHWHLTTPCRVNHILHSFWPENLTRLTGWDKLWPHVHDVECQARTDERLREPEREPEWARGRARLRADCSGALEILACITINLPPKCRLCAVSQQNEKNALQANPPVYPALPLMHFIKHNNNCYCTNIQQTRHKIAFTKLDWIILFDTDWFQDWLSRNQESPTIV